MYGCENCTIKKAERWRIDAFELWCWRRLSSPLACKEIQSVNPKGDQYWIFIGRTDVEAETPILLPLNEKNWLTGKDHDSGKDWRWEEKGVTEDEVVGWHHRLNGHEFEQTLGDGEGQGSLVCCSPWGHKESDMTEQLNWTDSKAWNRKSMFLFALEFRKESDMTEWLNWTELKKELRIPIQKVFLKFAQNTAHKSLSLYYLKYSFIYIT